MLKTTTQPKRPLPNLVALPSPSTISDSPIQPIDRLTPDYLAIVFKALMDKIFPFRGFLLLNQKGELIQSSPQGKVLCEAIQGDLPESGKRDRKLPSAIADLASHLIESRELFPKLKVQLQDDVFLEASTRVRIQGEWIDLDSQHPPCMVVTLEDLTKVAQERAVFDAHCYQFTQRETEVWELYLQGLSYRQISEMLFISLNTVKLHMKHIHSKRKSEVY